MPKALTLGNGNILVNIDEHGEVRDFYYPYVGLENHISGHYAHKVGVWTDDKFSWLGGPDWQTTLVCEKGALAGRITAINQHLGVRIEFTDLVYNERNVFIRRLALTNDVDRRRQIKIFFYHQFELYESHIAHTAFYDPINKAIIHYRNQRVFLANALIQGKPFDDYSTGVFGGEGKEGTWRDAEDGHLAKNAIEHGQADSCLGLSGDYDAKEEQIIHYWLAVGSSIKEAVELNRYVLEKGASHMIKTTTDYWHAWIHRRNFSFWGLSEPVIDLFQKSLFIVRAHVGNNGSIVASGDSNRLQKGKDTYAYVWPRDASFSAVALTRSGDFNVTKRHFEFCNQTISDEGYFLHKFSPDGSLGSSWHPWLHQGELQLPIQEDETAVVIYSLLEYYRLSRDLEFIESLYQSLIKKAADFMVLYRDDKTGLPKPTYDLWEERFGVSTYTTAAVYGALLAAAEFAGILGKVKTEKRYHDTAMEIREALLKHLYDDDKGYFYKLVNFDERGQLVPDQTMDVSNVYGIYNFNVLSIDDPRLTRALRKTEMDLWCRTVIGGLARYTGDTYYRVDQNLPGNPWIISTLWRAQYYIAAARSEADLKIVKDTLEWVVQHATPTSILSEQIHPYTGEQLSVAPLTWSHSEFVLTVLKYLDKLEALGICPACNPVD